MDSDHRADYYKNMPELSRFLDISILMYFDDHNPPHFHVRYNDERALISISELKVLEGHLPARILGLVIEWAELHKDELMRDWDMVKTRGDYFKIAPLV
jgi:hypothetical protein